MRTVITLLLTFTLALPVFAQSNSSTSSPVETEEYNSSYAEPASTTSENTSPEFQIEKLRNELWYIILLAALCVITLTIVLNFLKHKPDHTAKDIVNTTGLTLIIFGTIILVLVVNTSEQLTAAIGILGAIAGYLFRSVQNGETETTEK